MYIRFIPALAGNSIRVRTFQDVLSVHPRACGEQAIILRPGAKNAGSSPRLRGTVTITSLDLIEQRFIPALAGNSVAIVDIDISNAVHPRACGEQEYILQHKDFVCGSSPRLRGTVSDNSYCRHSFRFIPALAGNSFDD